MSEAMSERSEFVDEVLALAEEMAFPVDRENALSLIQLTLGLLARKREVVEFEYWDDEKARKAGDYFVRRILVRRVKSGRKKEGKNNGKRI